MAYLDNASKKSHVPSTRSVDAMFTGIEGGNTAGKGTGGTATRKVAPKAR